MHDFLVAQLALSQSDPMHFYGQKSEKPAAIESLPEMSGHFKTVKGKFTLHQTWIILISPTTLHKCTVGSSHKLFTTNCSDFTTYDNHPPLIKIIST